MLRLSSHGAFLRSKQMMPSHAGDSKQLKQKPAAKGPAEDASAASAEGTVSGGAESAGPADADEEVVYEVHLHYVYEHKQCRICQEENVML